MTITSHHVYHGHDVYDAVVVGSGPNGLAAAITLAAAGHKTLVLEAKETIGGGMRTLELTLPGFQHDVCSAVHPLAAASPFFRNIPLAKYGVQWAFPEVEAAHPLDSGPALLVKRSVAQTAAQLGRDGANYQRIFAPLVARYEQVLDQFLGPLRFPRHPLLTAFFGLLALQSARGLAKLAFREPGARALFAGMAAHAIIPLEQPATAAFGLMLGLLAHAVGWPIAVGGSQRLADGLAAHLRSLGGEIAVGVEVKSPRDLPPARAYLFDLTPRQLLRIMGDVLPPGYRRQLERYRYGPGVFKVDYALSEPVPWRDRAVSKVGTVHLGGTIEEISRGERDAWQGRHPERPYVLLVQPSGVDPSRAPAGKHTLWAYCHVPHGSTRDLADVIDCQIERFAPGFRQVVLARHTRHASAMESYNANYVGGDINGGVQDLRQLFTRPAVQIDPYVIPARAANGARLYICSSATPPGGGVHGMCGFFAARSVLRQSHRRFTAP